MQDPPRVMKTFDSSFGKMNLNNDSKYPSLNDPQIAL